MPIFSCSLPDAFGFPQISMWQQSILVCSLDMAQIERFQSRKVGVLVAPPLKAEHNFWLIHTAWDRGRYRNRTGTIGNNGFQYLSLSWSRVKISK